MTDDSAQYRGISYRNRRYLNKLELSIQVQQGLFTYVKGVGLLLALLFALYPAILIVQLLTDTVTESLVQILVLLGLSLIAWVWILRLYRAYRTVGLTMKASE